MRLAILTVLSLLALAPAAAATPGDPDLSFDSDGLLTTAIGNLPGNQDQASDIALMPDGRIVAAGWYDSDPGPGNNPDFAVTRYTPSGMLDPTFGGGDGVATTPVGTGTDFGSAVAIDSQNRIVVGGQAAMPGGVDFALARFTEAGVLDSSFDGDGGAGNGVVSTPIASGTDRINDLVLQPDGKIVAVGIASVAGNGFDFAIARFNPSDGSLDDSFSGNGLDTEPIAAADGTDSAAAVTLAPGPAADQTDIVVAGDSEASDGDPDFSALRYTPTGDPDGAFGGGDGKVTVPLAPAGENEGANAVAYTRSGIVMAGTADIPVTGNDVALVRLTDGGVLDGGFGSGGRAIAAFAAADGGDQGEALDVQADGKLVVGGFTELSSSDDDLMVARFLPGGTVDTTFSGDGVATRTVAPTDAQDTADAIAIQPDGKIVTAGSANSVPTTGQDIVLARFHGLEGDVSVSLSDGPDPVAAGSPITYTATVSNAGPDPAEGVKLALTTPAGSETRDLGTIASGGSTAVTVPYTPATPGALSASASVSSSTRDTNQSNNSAAQTSQAVDGTAPAISSLSLSAKTFRVARGATPVSAQKRRRRTPAGSRFRFGLSEAASVRIAIQRALPGRRVGRRCVKPTPRLRKRRLCTRYSKASTLRRRLAAGRQNVKFTGRIGRRALKRGRYRATLTAVDAAGNRSAPRRVTFRIVR